MSSLVIVLLSAIALVIYAKRKGSPRKRRRYSLRRVRVTPLLALSTLGSTIALVTGVTGASTSSYRAMSLKQTWSIVGMTEGEGPITVGYAHSNYTVTEIKEALESSAAIDPGLKVEQEKTNRLIRIVGVFSSPSQFLNHGDPISTRLNWLISIGKAVNIFVYNENAAPLTTGAVVNAQGNLWVKDSA